MKQDGTQRTAWAFGWLWYVLTGTWIASGVAGWRWLTQRPSAGLLFGMGAEAILLGAGILVAMRWNRWFRERTWTAFLILAGVGLKLPALWISSTYAQVADRGFFVSFVNRLAETGLTSAGIGEMAGSIYDFYSFFPRSFALALPLRLLVGEEAMVGAHQWVSLAMGVLSTWMVYELFRTLFRERTARVASALHLLFPLRNVIVLDFAHQVPGEFTLLLGLLSVLGMMRSRGARTTVGWGALVTATLCLGHLLVGVEWLLAGLGLGLLVTVWRTFPEATRRRQALGLAVAVLVAGGAIRGFDSWQQRAAPLPLSSGQPGFMARGWSFRFMGEYDARLEQVDREAPPDVKAAVMRAYVGSQIRNHPVQVFGRLLPVKAVKYLLPGFASGTEQALHAGGHVAASEMMAGARLLFAFGLLAAAIAGCLIRPENDREHRGWLFCLAVLGLSCAAQVIGGETSPRYAYYLHFALIGIAARGLESSARFSGGRSWALAGLLHAGLYGVLAVVATVGFRLAGDWRFLRGRDTLILETPSGEWGPASLHDGDYFWQTVLPGGTPSDIRLSVQQVPEAHSQMHVFVHARQPAGWQISADGRSWRPLRGVQSLVLPLPSRQETGPHPAPGAVVQFRHAGEGAAEEMDLQLGYVLTGAWDSDAR